MFRFRRFPMAWRPTRAAGFEGLWAAAVILPAIAFVAAAVDTSRVVHAEVRAQAVRVADMMHEHAASAFESQEGLLTATVRRVQGMDGAEVSRSAEVRAFIRDIDERMPGTAAVGLVAPDGRLVAVSRRGVERPTVDVSARDYVRAHREEAAPFLSRGGTFVTDVFVTEPNRMTVVGLSRATLARDGTADGGVVIATFQPERLDRFYGRIAEHAGDRVLLARADGAVLAQYPPLPDPVAARLAAGHPLVAAMAAGSVGGLVEAAGRDGVDRLYAYRRIGSYPVYAAYGTDRAVIGAQIRQRLVAPGLVAALGMAILLASTARAQRATARMLAAERARTDSEARLRQLERVGAFGELAAGVAHDFRNAAQVMESCARLLHRSAGNPEQVRAHADMVAHAATLVATLTNRMLDIARRRPPRGEQAAFDAWRAVSGLAELLNRTVGGGCRVSARLEGVGGRMVQADLREFESALVNLVVNARDAMPEGGEVVLTVGDPPAMAAAPEGLEGSHVAVAVIDQGMGMDEQTLARAGEPFFTTKPDGQGTGLGLAGARGFAERAGGRLLLHSTPGKGTVAVLWLPVGGAGAPGASAPGLSHSPEAA